MAEEKGQSTSVFPWLRAGGALFMSNKLIGSVVGCSKLKAGGQRQFLTQTNQHSEDETAGGCGYDLMLTSMEDNKSRK